MKKYEVYWTKTAKRDLMSIIEYISMDSLNIAKKKYAEIKEVAESLEHFPSKGRIIPELKKNNISKYHEILLSPWRIMYRFDNSNIYILAVNDGRRNIEDVLLARHLDI